MAKEEADKNTYYFCNAHKNDKCTKTGCGYLQHGMPGCSCYTTINKEFAITNSDGEPLIYTDEKLSRVHIVLGKNGYEIKDD